MKNRLVQLSISITPMGFKTKTYFELHFNLYPLVKRKQKQFKKLLPQFRAANIKIRSTYNYFLC
jgi:hypothetical protein